MRERGPYGAAVPPYIAKLALPQLDDEAVAAAEEAVLELGRSDGEVGSIAAPFSAILLRRERGEFRDRTAPRIRQEHRAR